MFDNQLNKRSKGRGENLQLKNQLLFLSQNIIDGKTNIENEIIEEKQNRINRFYQK